eukprot:246854-Amphidinium_carterae.1
MPLGTYIAGFEVTGTIVPSGYPTSWTIVPSIPIVCITRSLSANICANAFKHRALRVPSHEERLRAYSAGSRA